MMFDFLATDPDLYRVLYENDAVRVSGIAIGPVIAPSRIGIPTVSCTR